MQGEAGPQPGPCRGMAWARLLWMGEGAPLQERPVAGVHAVSARRWVLHRLWSQVTAGLGSGMMRAWVDTARRGPTGPLGRPGPRGHGLPGTRPTSHTLRLAGGCPGPCESHRLQLSTGKCRAHRPLGGECTRPGAVTNWHIAGHALRQAAVSVKMRNNDQHQKQVMKHSSNSADRLAVLSIRLPERWQVLAPSTFPSGMQVEGAARRDVVGPGGGCSRGCELGSERRGPLCGRPPGRCGCS